MTQSRLGVLAIAFLLVGCARVTVVHDVDEKQANEIVVLLHDHGIAAHKHRVEDGRDVAYSVAVPARREVRAMQLTGAHRYPRETPAGYETLVEDDSIIPTAQEEQIRKAMALEGEIEQLLGVHAGILEVEANVAIPEERDILTSGSVKPRTASVSVVYLAGLEGARPLNSVEIQALVATSVDGLEAGNVSVMMTAASVPKKPKRQQDGGGLTLVQERTVFIGVGVVMVLLCLAVIYAQLRLRSVRARLIKLQTEVQKARGKPERKAA